MEQLVALTVTRSKVKHDDDFTDRLSHRYTCIVLVVFTTIVVANLYVGSPITCWVPNEFTGSHTKYTNNYCWVKNTYYLPFDDYIPREDEHHKRQMIIYYQWIPFIFLLQAVFFYLPSIVWHGLNSKAGIDSDNILDCATKLCFTEKAESRDNLLGLLVNQIHRFLTSRQDRVAGWKVTTKNIMNLLFCSCCGKRMGSYLVILFIISKLIYGFNVIVQMYLLKEIFLIDSTPWGMDLDEMLNSVEDGTQRNPSFPRITFCDFIIRRLGNLHRYTVQCVLPINLYMKFMYVFLWFWMLLVAIATFLSLFTWILRFIWYSDRRLFIMNHLTAFDRLQDGASREILDEFLHTYLRQDGAFILRLIAHNTNNITTSEVTCALWDHWIKRKVPPQTPVGTPRDKGTFELEPPVVVPVDNGHCPGMGASPPPWSNELKEKQHYMDSPL